MDATNPTVFISSEEIFENKNFPRQAGGMNGLESFCASSNRQFSKRKWQQNKLVDTQGTRLNHCSESGYNSAHHTIHSLLSQIGLQIIQMASALNSRTRFVNGVGPEQCVVLGIRWHPV